MHKYTSLLKSEASPKLPVKQAVEIAWKDLSGKARIDETKPPLVMIHGLFGSKLNYSSTARRISSLSHIKTIGLDMRNHGGSQHVMPHDYISMANDTIKYIDHLRERVFLAGHLMGAKVAMIVALKRPELIEKLIVIDNAPSHDPLDKRFARHLLGMYAAEKRLGDAVADKFRLQKKVDSVLAEFEPDPLVRLFLASNLRSTKNASCEFRIPALSFLKENVLFKMEQWPEADLSGLKYPGPVMVMRGIRSSFILEKHLAEAFPKYFPNFQTIDFDCGHWVVNESPDKFVDEVLKFLAPETQESNQRV